MIFTKPRTLRQALVWPFAGLVVILSVLIGTLSYQAGNRAVETLSTNLLHDTVGRIEQSVYRQLTSANARLEIAMPYGVSPPQDISTQLDPLVQRLWLAATPSGGNAPYVYFANTKGQFVGTLRTGTAAGEVRLQAAAGEARQIFKKAGIDKTMELVRTETSIYNAHQRPWYLAAVQADAAVWTEVYQDFKDKDLVITRATKINHPDTHQLLGVVAVDLPLAGLQSFLSGLKTSPHGIAFVAEANGALIASSGITPASVALSASPMDSRQTAATADSAAIRTAWETIRSQLKFEGAHASQPQHFAFTLDGASLSCAFLPIHADTGLKWVAAVIIPQSDFTGDLTGNALLTALLAMLAVGATVWLGSRVVGAVVGDIHLLSDAVRRIGHGELDVPMPDTRHTEIAEMTESLSVMQVEISVDQLTGSTSRSALMRHMAVMTRLYGTKPQEQLPPFVLLFLDLNRFKAINDTFGHQAGDSTLVEVAQRLRLAVRGGDLLARFGGDEFVIVLWRIRETNDVDNICNKIRALLHEPISALSHLKGSEAYTVGASIGASFFPADSNDMEELIKLADARMYSEKSKGKTR